MKYKKICQINCQISGQIYFCKCFVYLMNLIKIMHKEIYLERFMADLSLVIIAATHAKSHLIH